MAELAHDGGGRRGTIWRIAGWGTLAALLALPAVAMPLGAEGVVWTASDFVAMGLLFALLGGGVELAVKLSFNLAYRLAAAGALFTAFLTIWVNLAVGMIGSEDNPHNLAFLAVIVLALAGAVLARFRAEGMARAMALAGAAQLVAAVAGFPADERGAIFSALFALPWLLAAALFRKAALDGREAKAA